MYDEVFVKVNCRINGKYCGRCCYETEMPLTVHDILEIVSRGFKREYFVDESNGIPRLKNVDGHCVFLDPSTNACRIYGFRPIGCRLYPLVYDQSSRAVVVDKSCPRWREVSIDDINKYRGILLRIIREIYGGY